MFECLTKINWKKVGLFASGTLFGTAGIKALASDDAKKLYTNCTAAVLRAKETVMNTVTTVQENAEDIYEGAKQINEERAEAKAAAEFAEEAEEETTEEVMDYKAGDSFFISAGKRTITISGNGTCIVTHV